MTEELMIDLSSDEYFMGEAMRQAKRWEQLARPSRASRCRNQPDPRIASSLSGSPKEPTNYEVSVQ